MPNLLVLAILTALVAQSLAQEPGPRDPFSEGGKVQLQGCMLEAERKGTYIFSRVTAWPVATTPNGAHGPLHFWLANAAAHNLGAHVGRTIQVTGTVTDVRESEVERNPGYSSRDGRRVAIELPEGDVITSLDLSGVSPDQIDSRTDMKITLLKVKIDSVLVVLPNCLPMRY